MPEPIRVRDDVTGHEYSTYGVDENGKPYEGLTKLDEPAVDVHGELLPAKYPTEAEPEPAPTGDAPATVTPAKKAAAAPRTDSKPNTEES